MKRSLNILTIVWIVFISTIPVLTRLSYASNQQESLTAVEYVKQGSEFYQKNEFKKAIGPYNRALELEKKRSELNPILWHVLVDNLGMSYGITGDLKKAKETFEYGLTKDDKYPLFYYNLACTYAEMDDLEKTLVQLKLAFEFRKNMLPGETMPDPAKDDSFQRFMRNERFLAFISKLKNTDQNVPNNEQVIMTDKADFYVMTVPVSRIAMAIQKGKLVPSKPEKGSTSPHYFYLEDKETSLIISGWFEPEQSFVGLQKFWASEIGAFKRNGLAEPQNVSFEDIGNWSAIVYDIQTSNIHNSHIRAEQTQLGTWIDVHISLSMNLPETEMRAKLRDILRAIQVTEKKP
jgi:tetratricopeptide (TPR) repeat protein